MLPIDSPQNRAIQTMEENRTGAREIDHETAKGIRNGNANRNY